MDDNQVIEKLEQFFPEHKFKIIKNLVIDNESPAIKWSQESKINDPAIGNAEDVLFSVLLEQVNLYLTNKK